MISKEDADKIIDKMMAELVTYHQIDEAMRLAQLMHSRGVNFVPVIVESEEERNRLLDEQVAKAKALFMKQHGRSPDDPLN